jgi:hypothetical protein
MLTPAIVVETGSSRTVTWRVHPPDWSLMWASENEKRRFGSVPESVDGGTSTSGFWRSRSTLRGPRSVPP